MLLVYFKLFGCQAMQSDRKAGR